DPLAEVLCDDVLHLLRKRAGIADRSSFLDAACKRDGIRPAADKISCPQDRFLRRTSAAVNKADDLDLLLDPGKSACPLPDGFKIRGTRTVVFGLHASDDSQLHFLH